MPATAQSAPERDTASSILVRIRGLSPTLTATHQRIAAEILGDPARVAGSTIGELAQRCATSLTTITRFCRELGLPGYPDLRLALATEMGRSSTQEWSRQVGAPFSPDDPMSTVLRHVVATDVRAMEETALQLDTAVLERAVEALVEAAYIDIYAVSGSAGPAMDLQLRLHAIGRPCGMWKDVHDAICSAAVRTERDVAIGISHSGATTEVVEALEIARDRGATTIAVTNFPRSPITEAADMVLTTAAQNAPFRSGGLAGRHTQMLVVDCLYIGVAQRTREATERALASARSVVSRHRLPSR